MRIAGFTATQKTYNQQIVDDNNILCPLTMGHRRRVTSGATQGYMVLVNGVEPLPIRLQGDCSTIGAKPACLAGQRGLEPR